jgi:folate-dependent phosphoribosylglycinamide formyltransferase PurN
MNSKRLRLMILTHGSHKAAAIIERILALPCAEIAGIFVETETTPRYRLSEKLRRSIRYDGFLGTLAKYARRLLDLPRQRKKTGAGPSPSSHERLRDIAADHGVPVHFVPNYHLPESIALMRATEPDLGVVLGTNILKESVFAIPRLGSINTHQGLAPYYRGGPPVFWELFNGESEVGLTVHFVAAKVDTGDIIAQETLPLIYDYSRGLDYEPFLTEYRAKLSDRAAVLVPQAIQMLAEGRANLRPQNVELGKRYRLPLKKEKDELRRRLRQRLRLTMTTETTKVGVSNS